MNQEEIMKILPHRDQMLLVEAAEAREGIDYGSYHVRGDEWFLKGHFPGNPVVPGVILCEMMAQCAAVLLSGDVLEQGEGTPFFTTLNNVKFRNSVRPGDTFETQCSITRVKKPFYFATGKGFVEGKLCVSADFSFAVVKEG